MKLIHKVYIWAMPIALMLAACSTDKDTDNGNNEVEVGADGLSFVLQEENFDSDVSTRSIPQPVDAGTIDLGNGIEAEVSIQRDGAEPTRANGVTRATPVSDGHYIIRVYNASGQLLSGQGKELSGKFKKGKFIRDAGKHLHLNPGTYKFVCTTDKVSLDPTFGTGTISTSQGGSILSKEMIGVTEKVIASGKEQVTFLMHHRVSRARFRLTGYTEQLTNVKAQFFFPSGPSSHFYIKIPTGFQGPSAAVSDWYSDKYSLPSTPTERSETYVLGYDFVSEYKYINRHSPVTLLFLNLSGTIYGKNVDIKNKLITLAQQVDWKDNGSYTINIKLKPTQVLYLFNDGSCGILAEKGARTPIGAVVRKKTNTKDGIAIALKDADDGLHAYTTPYDWTKMNIQHNTTHYTDEQDAANDLDGYKWTYEATGSVDGRIKANFPGDYTPFYKAAQYNPGVAITGTNISKWYVPALGEWYLAWKAFGRWNGVFTPLKVDINAMNSIFTAAGGDAFKDYGYWNSTEFEGMMRPTLERNETTFKIGLNATHNIVARVRPFVHF